MNKKIYKRATSFALRLILPVNTIFFGFCSFGMLVSGYIHLGIEMTMLAILNAAVLIRIFTHDIQVVRARIKREEFD